MFHLRQGLDGREDPRLREEWVAGKTMSRSVGGGGLPARGLYRSALDDRFIGLDRASY